MTKRKAFLFDLNGTMVDDMDFHLQVWYDVIVNDLGAKMSLPQVKSHMYGKSQELLVRIFGTERFTPRQLDEISLAKEVRYRYAYRPHLDLLPGLFAFLEASNDANIGMAIGSAAIPANIDFVVDTLKVRHYFPVIVSADDVMHSKPHPETYIKCAELLGVSPEECVVFEDVPKGVEAAWNAGMKSVVVTTTHGRKEFDSFDNIIAFIDDYSQLAPADLFSRQICA